MKKTKRVLSFLMCVLFSVQMNGAFAAWDGYDTDENELTVVDMNIPANIISAGISASRTHTKTAAFSAHYNNNLQKKSILFKDVPRDWSEYGSIQFWMYSAKKLNKAGFTFFVNSDPEWETGSSSHQVWFTAEFEGWKLITIPLSSMAVSRDASFAKVTGCGFHTTWLNPYSDDNMDVYIDSIRLIKSDPKNILFSQDTLSMSEKTEKTSFIVHTDSEFVINKGKKDTLLPKNSDVKAIEKNDCCYIPAQTFENFLGAKLKNGVLSIGEKSFSKTETSDGILYVPAYECARALGLEAFENMGLTVIGKNAENIEKNSDLVYCLSSHLMYREVDPESVTEEEYTALREKIRYMLVGDETNDLENSIVKGKIKTINTTAETLYATLNKPASKADEIFNLFGNEALPQKSTPMGKMCESVRDLAYAYGTYGSELYKNEQLLEDILYCLEWIYDNVYGKNCLTNSGFLNGYGDEWTAWLVVAPRAIADTITIIEPDASKLLGEKKFAELTEKYFEPAHKFVDQFDTKDGSNVLWMAYIALEMAIMEKDAAAIAVTRDKCQREFQYVEYFENTPYNEVEKSENGMHVDGSYIMHLHHAMTGAYGATLMTSVGKLLYALSESRFELSSPLSVHFEKWITESLDPLMYKGGIMSMTTGRVRKTHRYVEKYNGIEILTGMLDILESGVITEESLPRVKQVIKHHLSENTFEGANNVFSFRHLKMMEELLKDESIPVKNDIYAKIYGSMDEFVQHREDYSVAISASSERVYAFEALNSENKNGWYQGDGMVYIYNDQDEFDHNYWYNVNPYRMSGVTADTLERKIEPISQGHAYLSGQDFVGGVSLDGGFMTAAMSLESFHEERIKEEQIAQSNNVFGKDVPSPHNSSLTAKKAWFLFDDEVVALGTDIDSRSGANVETTVENRKSKKTVSTVAGLDVKKHKIMAVEATGTADSDGNTPENAIDADTSTAWAAESGATITFDFGESLGMGSFMIAFYNGNGRKISFDLEVSDDKINWSEPMQFVSDGTDTFTEFPVNKTGRYLRFTGHGADVSTWNSIKEVIMYAKMPDGVEFSAKNIQNVGTEKITVNGEEWENLYNTPSAKEKVKYVHLEDYGGIYFPAPVTLWARRSNTTPSFNELWLDHGKDPQNESYAYCILPNKTPEQTEKYSKKPDIRVLANNEKVQAVADTSIGVTGIVFWEKGSFGGITVTKPCIVMTRETDEKELIVFVADPTHKLTECTVTIENGASFIGADSDITDVSDDKNAAFKVNFINSAGKTFCAKYQKK